MDAREKIDQFETELAILKEQGKIRGYIFAVMCDDQEVLIADNATTVEVFGLAQAVIQKNVAGRSEHD